MKRTFVVAFAALLALLAGSAGASSRISEITDMWWDPEESGWGVNVILQKDVGFITFFVYDFNRKPIWYTSDIHFQEQNGQGTLVWKGTLYTTEGPWFGGAFPPASVSSRAVGTVSFSVSSVDQALLSYTVDDATVLKALHRQTWANEDYSGSYGGGYSIRAFACNPASLNKLDEQFGAMTVNHTDSRMTLGLATSADTCNFAGDYVQTGKLGQVTGTYSCAGGVQGTFIAYEMTPTISGFTARVRGQNQYCQWQGFLGGIRRSP